MLLMTIPELLQTGGALLAGGGTLGGAVYLAARTVIPALSSAYEKRADAAKAEAEAARERARAAVLEAQNDAAREAAAATVLADVRSERDECRESIAALRHDCEQRDAANDRRLNALRDEIADLRRTTLR